MGRVHHGPYRATWDRMDSQNPPRAACSRCADHTGVTWGHVGSRGVTWGHVGLAEPTSRSLLTMCGSAMCARVMPTMSTSPSATARRAVLRSMMRHAWNTGSPNWRKGLRAASDVRSPVGGRRESE
eukprot:5604398-Prymnesium_polylepis.1